MADRTIGTAVTVDDNVHQAYELLSASASWVTSEDDVMSSCSIMFSYSFFSLDLSHRGAAELLYWKTVVLAPQTTLQL